MGKDRRKRDRRQPGDAESANSVEATLDTPTPLEPRGQREPRNRAGQERREPSIKKDAVTAEKPASEKPEAKVETKEALPDPAVLFANLKRETDDIKALTEKKYSKRQIFSNWSRYEEPLPDPVQEQELPGADFTALCRSISSDSSYFRFKSEHSWDTNISALSSELFSLNADNLALGLCCIPFYERLDLPITLFSETDIQNMELSAKNCKKKYETDFCKKKEIDILNILKERSNAEDNLPLKTEREKTPDHKPTLSFTIDRPETPDDFEGNMSAEMYEPSFNVQERGARISANSARKGSPDITDRMATKMQEANNTPQDFRTESNRPNPEKQEINVQELKENVKRSSPEFSFNTNTQREEIRRSSIGFEENKRQSPVPVEKVTRPTIEEHMISEEIEENSPETSNIILQRQSVSPDTEKIKALNKQDHDMSPEVPSTAVQQSEPAPEEATEKSVPVAPEILPPRQRNKNKLKDKNKHHSSEMGTSTVSTSVTEAGSAPLETKTKVETETALNAAADENVRPQEEEQKPPAPAESLSQRSKKRRSKEKGQHANKTVENNKMPTQEKPENVVKLSKEEKTKLTLQDATLEKAKSPSPEKPFVKPQENPAEVKPKQGKLADTAKVVQNKPVEKVESKAEKPAEKPKAPAQANTVETAKPQTPDDDLDFLLTLKKPVRESQVTPAASTQVSKPSIEEEDTSAKPAAFKFPQQTEDLEDWLDSILDD